MIDVMGLASAGLAFFVRAVGGPGGYDSAVYHAVVHESFGVAPEFCQSCFRDSVSWAKRIQARTKEQLGAIDVPDASDDRLIHEQGANRSAAFSNAVDHELWVGIFAQRVGADTGDQILAVFFVEHIAGGGATEFDPVISGGDAQPQCAFGFGKRHLAVAKFSVEAEVDMKMAVFAEVVKEMLAVDIDGSKFSTVELLRSIDEAPVRSVDCDYASREDGGVTLRIAVQFISLGH